MMNAMFTKWGSVIILVVILGVLGVSLFDVSKGISTWLTDSYLPKKYILIEYGGVRFVMYGQFPNQYEDYNQTKPINFVNNIMNLVLHAKPITREYDYPIDVNFDSNFNSRQIRSSSRSEYKEKNNGK